MNKEAAMESLARDIYEWCKDKEMWGDNIIYFNGKAWANLKEWGGISGKEIDEYLYEYENRNPLDYFEYANTETLSMSFEGVLYELLNGFVSRNVKLKEEFSEIFKKHGYHYEFGHAWNLSIYEI